MSSRDSSNGTFFFFFSRYHYIRRKLIRQLINTCLLSLIRHISVFFESFNSYSSSITIRRTPLLIEKLDILLFKLHPTIRDPPFRSTQARQTCPCLESFLSIFWNACKKKKRKKKNGGDDENFTFSITRQFVYRSADISAQIEGKVLQGPINPEHRFHESLIRWPCATRLFRNRIN